MLCAMNYCGLMQDRREALTISSSCHSTSRILWVAAHDEVLASPQSLLPVMSIPRDFSQPALSEME